jgi:subtilisin family serine protease
VMSYPSDQIAALERVLLLRHSHNIAAVNMSLGTGEYSTICDPVNFARAAAIMALRAHNIVTVAAAGNEGYTKAIGAPACIATAVAVGATTNADDVTLNRGPLLDLFAPGQGIVSAVPGSGYGSKSGTSMAAPHVAGAFAILRQAFPAMPVAEALQLMNDTGVPITYMSGGGNVTTRRLDLLAALGARSSPPLLTADQLSVIVKEGARAVGTGTYRDPDGGAVRLAASIGGVVDSGDGTWTWTFQMKDGPG